jgi:hypothetical protein
MDILTCIWIPGYVYLANQAHCGLGVFFCKTRHLLRISTIPLSMHMLFALFQLANKLCGNCKHPVVKAHAADTCLRSENMCVGNFHQPHPVVQTHLVWLLVVDVLCAHMRKDMFLNMFINAGRCKQRLTTMFVMVGSRNFASKAISNITAFLPSPRL